MFLGDWLPAFKDLQAPPPVIWNGLKFDRLLEATTKTDALIQNYSNSIASIPAGTETFARCQEFDDAPFAQCILARHSMLNAPGICTSLLWHAVHYMSLMNHPHASRPHMSCRHHVRRSACHLRVRS